jgi:D-tagatose-1,6-bisphosphate aldolase subunit GatZ/KbaZ
VTSLDYLRRVAARTDGRAQGVYSVCSANRFVLEAAMHEARSDESVLLVESTSNQVNQLGGYTGMTPLAFASYVGELASQAGLPGDRIILGGDHLGPNPWRRETAASAMDRARELVRQYVRAGYTKIHIDTSMRLGDDPCAVDAALDDATITERAADLAEVAEATHPELPTGAPAPLYVIGTDVPVPGGEQGSGSRIWVTSAEQAERTIELTRAVFERRRLAAAFERVVGVVVQPGVEFGDGNVFEYDRSRAAPLKAAIEARPGRVYEAHSTDYQTAAALREMVEDHFCILKVGPWLTFAFREAVFALETIEREWLSGRAGVALSGLRGVMESLMLRQPAYWEPYYSGDEAERRFARSFSLSDRIRYYWSHPEAETALARLISNLSAAPIPLSLVAQYLPVQYNPVREGRLDRRPKGLIMDKILAVLGLYASACHMKG